MVPLLKDFAHGRRTLYAQGRLVIAPFHAFARLRQEKDAVSFHEVIQIGRTILGRFLGGKDDKMGSFPDHLGEYNPPGRQEKPAAERLFPVLKMILQERCSLRTYEHSLLFSC